MKKVEFEVAGKRYSYDIPENWGELTQQQFIDFAGGIGEKDRVDPLLAIKLLGIDDVVAVSLGIADWWLVCSWFDWMRDLDRYTVGKMDTVTLPDGNVCLGFSDDFSDVTWQEWMIADSNANTGQWDVVAAVLYRPRRADWDHTSDPRREFSQWDCDARLPQFQRLDAAALAAVALNYKLMRQQLTRRYRRLFSGGSHGKNGGSDLHTLIRNVMGDNFYEEDKYLKLSVPSVLFQLDRMVREERERRHNARTN